MARKKRRKPGPPRRRSAIAVIARRLGHRIKPSKKVYRRRPKHVGRENVT